MKYSFLTRDSHAKKACISEAILLDNSAADFEVTQSLQTYPTTGILLDREHAMHVGTPKILNKWVDVLYPACYISRWDQLERRVRSLALPAHRKDTTGTAPKQYLNRLEKSSNTSPQNENIFETR